MSVQPIFTPRRIGHINLFVSDVERARDFYRDVCGIDYVFFENGIRMAFMTNGSSHHDVGLMQAWSKARIGREGYVQPSTGRGERAGLNHLAFEMESQAELVECYRRGLAADLKFHGTTDHQISRSIYLFDPDSNLLEFYADAMDDWRGFYGAHHGELISGNWNPQQGQPDATARYVKRFEPTRVPGAVFHPRALHGAGLNVVDLDRSVRFYTEVAGLELTRRDADCALLETPVTHSPITLVLGRSAEHELGLHHASFEVLDADELACAGERAKTKGVRVNAQYAAFGRRGIVVADVDGYQLEFFCRDAHATGERLPRGFAAAPLH